MTSMYSRRGRVYFGAMPGFTLVEMMVVVLIVAILAALAVPSFQNFISDQRQRSAASDLAGDLAEARLEAMKQKRKVIVAANPAWINGWRISVDQGEAFIDSNGDGIYNVGETFIDANTNGVYDGNLVLFKTTSGFTGSTMRICGATPAGAVNAGSFATRVVFRGDGTVANAVIGADDIIRVSDNLLRSRDIRISSVGRVSVDVYRRGDLNQGLQPPCP